jgi:hypothetical protein
MPFIVLLFIVVFSWLIGKSFWIVLARTGRESRLDEIVITEMIGFVLLSQLYCFLGLIGQLKREIFIIGVIVLSLPGLIDVWCSRNFLQNTARLAIKKIFWPIAMLCPMIYLGLTVATLPPLNWDEISYALTFPKLHIASGSFSYITEYGIFSAFPLFGETPIGIAYLLYSDPTAAHLTVLFFLILSLTLVYRLAVRCGTTRVGAWVCVLAVAYLPLTLGNIGTAKIEPYQLAYILASIYLLVICKEFDRSEPRLLSYIFIGFAAGIKYTTVFAAPFYLCAYMMATPLGSGISVHLRELGRLLLIGLVVNGAWLLINSLNVCNPFFPNLVSVFGQCLEYPVTKDIMDMMMEGTMMQKNTSWATTHSLENFYKLFVAGFGWINTILLALGIVLFLSRNKTRLNLNLRWLFAGIFITLLIQAFAIYWEFRYTYFAFSLILIFTILAFEQVFRQSALRAVIFTIIGFQAFQSFGNYFKNNPAVWLVMQGDVQREDYPDKFVHLYWVAKWLNENTPKDVVIAFNWGVQPFYYLERPFFFLHDWNPEENIQKFENSEQLFRTLRHRDVRYLVWRNQDDSGYIDPSKTKAFRARMNIFLSDLLAQGRLGQIYQRDDVRIFKVQEGGNSAIPSATTALSGE